MLDALKKEFGENEDLPSKTNPSEWYRIIGKGGERVVRVRSLYGKSEQAEKERKPQKTVRVGDNLS
jgi:proteasome-associated ATPase